MQQCHCMFLGPLSNCYSFHHYYWEEKVGSAMLFGYVKTWFSNIQHIHEWFQFLRFSHCQWNLVYFWYVVCHCVQKQLHLDSLHPARRPGYAFYGCSLLLRGYIFICACTCMFCKVEKSMVKINTALTCQKCLKEKFRFLVFQCLKYIFSIKLI